ncbi:hypothetical protein BAE44_0017264, partial [Dichanthelium oligosanthes]
LLAGAFRMMRTTGHPWGKLFTCWKVWFTLKSLRLQLRFSTLWAMMTVARILQKLPGNSFSS